MNRALVRTAMPIVLAQLLLCVGAVLAKTETSEQPIPSELETFVGRSGTEIQRANEVGVMDSSVARVGMTYLRAHDESSNQSMTGVRIDLVDENEQRSVFIPRDEIVPIADAVAQIERDANEWLISKDPNVPGCMGHERFWNHRVPAVRSLNVSYCLHPDWSGLSLTAFDGYYFRLPYRKPSELSSLMRQAYLSSKD